MLTNGEMITLRITNRQADETLANNITTVNWMPLSSFHFFTVHNGLSIQKFN